MFLFLICFQLYFFENVFNHKILTYQIFQLIHELLLQTNFFGYQVNDREAIEIIVQITEWNRTDATNVWILSDSHLIGCEYFNCKPIGLHQIFPSTNLSFLYSHDRMPIFLNSFLVAEKHPKLERMTVLIHCTWHDTTNDALISLALQRLRTNRINIGILLYSTSENNVKYTCNVFSCVKRFVNSHGNIA